MTPLDQHVGVDVMINPPSLVNFRDGKSQKILIIWSPQTRRVLTFFYNSQK